MKLHNIKKLNEKFEIEYEHKRFIIETTWKPNRDYK